MARAAYILWNVLRVPVLLFLVLLEPVVRTVLGTIALLGVLITFFFKFFGAPDFPFWTMLTISMAFAFVLMVYETLIQVLSK